MIPVGQQVARALTEPFYRWELRGRGSLVGPGAVQLEPPFRPFEGHYLAEGPVLEDGQSESLGSRFAKGLTGFLGIGPPPLPPVETEELEEPDAERSRDRGDLVELQIALPPEYQPHANVFEQFLLGIGYAREPVAFEVVGSAEELVVQITVGEADAVAVRPQWKAFFPEAEVTVGSRPLLAVVVRVVARAPATERVSELVRSLAGALRPLGHTQGNQLVPLTCRNFTPLRAWGPGTIRSTWRPISSRSRIVRPGKPIPTRGSSRRRSRTPSSRRRGAGALRTRPRSRSSGTPGWWTWC